MRIGRRCVTALLLGILVAGCSAPPILRRDGSTSARPFTLDRLAKGDIDNVAEILQGEQLASLRVLTLKLYKRNPAEWRKTGAANAEAATEALFRPLAYWDGSSGQRLDWQASLREAWDPRFSGDRVGATVAGLLSMQLAAWNHRTTFYLWNELDAQKLYNAARNLETAAWALASKRDAKGAPLLLSNGVDDAGVPNLSFEREFGKLIGLNDAAARIVEDKTNRAIRTSVVNVAGLVLLPL